MSFPRPKNRSVGRQSPRRRILLTMMIAPLMALPLLILGGSAANAATVAESFGYGLAFADIPSNSYYGQLRDTTTPDGSCVEMQRKTSTGSWVATGFHAGSNGGAEKTIVACSTTFQYWNIQNMAAVYGVRMIRSDGGVAAAFCTTKADCQTM